MALRPGTRTWSSLTNTCTLWSWGETPLQHSAPSTQPPGMRLTGQPSGEQALEPAIAVRCSRDPALPQRSVPARARAVNGQCVRIWSAGM